MTHIMLVTPQTARLRAKKLIENAREQTNDKQAVWIVTATFREMRIISDTKYLPGYTSLRTNPLSIEQNINVELYHGRSPDICLKLETHSLLAIMTIRNI